MKKMFREKTFGVDALARIQECDDILEDYQNQGYRLTLRQLYYQLVTKNVIENTERSYKNLGTLVSDARLAGLLDWDAMEDRGRTADVPFSYDDTTQLINTFKSAARHFTLPQWRGQENYVELWVEKDALSGVLEPLAQKHHVPLMVNKGYSSQSAMYAAAERINDAMETYEHEYATILYLGDHDPSGEDMVRDIRERLEMFAERRVEVIKVALTMKQVRQYNPPPNPAKITDSRAKAYIEQHGNKSWEVDALPPRVLGSLIDAEMKKWVDVPTRAQVIRIQEANRQQLIKQLEKIT